jgi:uncharacterized protein (TIGR01777 family)
MSAGTTILVTGATGLVGRRLVASLRGDGRAVRIVSRSAAPAGFDADVEVATWNGRDVPREALTGLAAVVHLAGEPVFGPLPTAAHMRRVRTSRVESTESLVAALGELPEAERPECFVCASAVGYYGSRGDTPLDESAAPGEGLLAEVCTAWERAARGAESLGLRTVRVRIGIVLAREGGALTTIAQVFRVGLGGRLGDGRQYFPWIAIDDLIALLRAAIDDPRWSGAVNAVAPGVVTNAEFTRKLGRQLGRRTWLPVPAAVVRKALGELSGELLGSRRLVPRVAQELGFRFAYPELEPALREALDR